MKQAAKLKIFLAGDTPSDMMACKNQLLSMGYTAVFFFGNQGACIKRLPLKPDLVISPARPRSAEGIELVKKIVTVNRHIKVIFTGGLPETRLQARVRKAEKRKMKRLRRQELGQKLLSAVGVLPLLARLSRQRA